MLKYESTLVTFTEVPDEIALCFNITGCPCLCKGCFEPWLREDIGKELSLENVKAEIAKHPHISCICFLGGDRDHNYLGTLIRSLKDLFSDKKFAMYSGFSDFDENLGKLLDYYKIGPFIPERGPLNSRNTNQVFLRKENGIWSDITYRFQREKE